jgi:hypothetical protein
LSEGELLFLRGAHFEIGSGSRLSLDFGGGLTQLEAVTD